SIAEAADLGLDRAQGLHDWARGEADEGERRRSAELTSGLALPKAQPTSSMGDDDFLAALSKAFQESEASRASAASNEAAEAIEGPDGTVETAGPDEGGNEG